MKYFKDQILPILIGAFITGVITLLASIFSDILPAIYPSLKGLSAVLYLKLLLLLTILLLISLLMMFLFYNKSKEFRPFKKNGKYKDFKWIADIKEYDPRRGWDIWINFLCPVHGVYLGNKDAKVPECSYHVLWCSHCNKEYPFHINGDAIHLEEIENVIKDKIIGKLRILNKQNL